MVYFSIFLKMASYKNIIQDLENVFKSVFIVRTIYFIIVVAGHVTGDYGQWKFSKWL